MPDPVYTPPPPAKKSAKGVTAPKTRMAPRLAPIPKVYETPEIDKVKKKVKAAAKKKTVNLVGREFADDQFHVTVVFSPAYGADAGRTYGAMLPLTVGADSPEGNKPFYVRALVEQSRVADPQLQAFGLRWEPPPDWSAIDGKGVFTYDESICNPLDVTRVYQSPSTISTEIGFRVVAFEKYLP